MVRKLFLFSLYVACAGVLYAQTATSGVAGVVKGSTGGVLPGPMGVGELDKIEGFIFFAAGVARRERPCRKQTPPRPFAQASEGHADL